MELMDVKEKQETERARCYHRCQVVQGKALKKVRSPLLVPRPTAMQVTVVNPVTEVSLDCSSLLVSSRCMTSPKPAFSRNKSAQAKIQLPGAPIVVTQVIRTSMQMRSKW